MLSSTDALFPQIASAAFSWSFLLLAFALSVAVKGDDRVSDAHASQHCDIYHNGSSGFGGNADIAETADLTLCLI